MDNTGKTLEEIMRRRNLVCPVWSDCKIDHTVDYFKCKKKHDHNPRYCEWRDER